MKLNLVFAFITSVLSPGIIVPPTEELDFDVLRYPDEAVKTITCDSGTSLPIGKLLKKN